MWKSVVGKQFEANVIIIDLLGFGKSPAPAWARYDAYLQARAVSFTLTKLGITRPVIVVGHSMGALVAVKLARRYPRRVDSLLLCSPPFYLPDGEAESTKLSPETLLKKLYQAVRSNPARFARLTTFATRYKLVNAGFNVTRENIATYMAALEGMILNQTAFEDTLLLDVPTYILRGNLDPFVVAKNLKYLETQNKNVTFTTVIAGHEIRGRFVPAIQKVLGTLLARSN